MTAESKLKDLSGDSCSWPGSVLAPGDAPGAPDRPGTRFRQPFGAVPVVLSLGYPATV